MSSELDILSRQLDRIDYAAVSQDTVAIKQLTAELRTLEKALREELYRAQNPPFTGRSDSWQAACGKARGETEALREELDQAKRTAITEILALNSTLRDQGRRLTAAEQRNAELERLLMAVSNDWLSGVRVPSPGTWFRERDELMTKPTESEQANEN
jgi:hypothetical protein